MKLVIRLVFYTLTIYKCEGHVESAKLEEECKIADICRHDQVPVCGIDSCGEMRTFIDTCDMHEFNCDSRKDFVQKPVHECWVTCKRGRSFKKPTYGEGCDMDKPGGHFGLKREHGYINYSYCKERNVFIVLNDVHVRRYNKC